MVKRSECESSAKLMITGPLFTAWAWHGKCESDTAALCKSNGKETF